MVVDSPPGRTTASTPASSPGVRISSACAPRARSTSTWAADASLVMQLGAEAVFVGSGIFKSDDPATRAAAIVEATTHFSDPARVAKASEGLGPAMQSLEARRLDESQLLAPRGW